MHKHILASLLLMTSAAAYSAPTIGTLSGYEPAVNSSCGLFLKNPAGELAFYADTSYDGFVNADGTVVKIHHVKTMNHQQVTGHVRSGDTYQTVFGTAGTQVKLDIRVVKGCEATGSTCPSVDEQGTLELTTASGQTSIPVTGGEHCANH